MCMTSRVAVTATAADATLILLGDAATCELDVSRLQIS